MLHSRSALVPASLVDALLSDLILPTLTAAPKKNGDCYAPPIDIVETEAAYEVRLEVPGIAAGAIEIELHQHQLTIKGQKADPLAGVEGAIRRRARPFGAFQHQVGFDKPIAEEAVTSTLKDGVLSITLPKIVAPRPRKVEVRTIG